MDPFRFSALNYMQREYPMLLKHRENENLRAPRLDFSISCCKSVEIAAFVAFL